MLSRQSLSSSAGVSLAPGRANRRRAALLVDHAHLDAGVGDAGRGEPLFPARMALGGVHLAAEMGDGHRAFALAVELAERAIAQRGHGMLEVADIHRRTAV